VTVGIAPVLPEGPGVSRFMEGTRQPQRISYHFAAAAIVVSTPRQMAEPFIDYIVVIGLDGLLTSGGLAPSMQKKPDDNVAQYKDRTDCAEDDGSDQIQLPFFWNGVGLVPNLSQFAQKFGVPLIVIPNWPLPSGLLGPDGTVNQSAGMERHGQEQLKEILLPDSF
jgi:hypothetical protein